MVITETETVTVATTEPGWTTTVPETTIVTQTVITVMPTTSTEPVTEIITLTPVMTVTMLAPVTPVKPAPEPVTTTVTLPTSTHPVSEGEAFLIRGVSLVLGLLIVLALGVLRKHRRS